MKKNSLYVWIVIGYFFCSSGFSATGALFTLAESGSAGNVSLALCLNGNGPLSCQNYLVSHLNLSILTTIPNHTYSSIGIKINTAGYQLASNVKCLPISNGYCLFTASDKQPASITIVRSTLILSSSILSTATINALYNQTITATGGLAPYTYAVTAGSLPPGISLNAATGVLSGVPTEIGAYSFSITASDSNTPVNRGTNTYSIQVVSNFAYIANRNADTISICSIESYGRFENCISQSKLSFHQPKDIVLNKQRNIAYVLNAQNSTISVCPVVDNQLSDEECTVETPGIDVEYSGLNPTGTILYTLSFSSDVVAMCSINSDGSLATPCSTSSGNGTFHGPNSRIGFHPNGHTLYVPNYNSDTISVCSVYSDGTINTCTPSFAGGLLSGPQGANVNSTGTVLYIADFNSATSVSKVVFCQILLNGNLGSCQQTTGNGTFNFSNNDVTNLFVGNAFGYFPNGGGAGKSISICPVQSDGSFGTCTTKTDALFDVVESVWQSIS